MAPPTLPKAFRERIKAHTDRLDKEDFYILVWGSGKSAREAYEKRLRIREHLAERFKDENVFMSEDAAFQNLMDQYGMSVAEAIQAGSVDALVILDTSIGPHSEILKYEDQLVGKAIVFVLHDHKDSSGFAAIAYRVLKTEGYTPEEYESCVDIRRKANDFAQALRMRKIHGYHLHNLFGR